MTEKSAGVLSGNIGVVVGAVLGVVSSFLGLLLKDRMDGWARKRDEIRWLCNELVGRLEAARLDVRSQRSVEYSSWMEELYSRHFSALRRWDTRTGAGGGLRQELIQIEGLLREYNNRRQDEVTVSKDIVRDLERRIGIVVDCLSR